MLFRVYIHNEENIIITLFKQFKMWLDQKKFVSCERNAKYLNHNGSHLMNKQLNRRGGGKKKNKTIANTMPFHL